jgi:hypothetical protein
MGPNVVAIAVALLAASSARAVTLRGPDAPEDLATASDVVLHARVASLQASEVAGRISTEVELAPLSWWKGAAVAASVRVRVPGGAVGNVAQVVHGAPSFAEGEEVVVFLRAGPSGFEVSRWALGKFTVRDGRATRTRQHVHCASGCEAEPRDELSLGELRERVRGAR